MKAKINGCITEDITNMLNPNVFHCHWFLERRHLSSKLQYFLTSKCDKLWKVLKSLQEILPLMILFTFSKDFLSSSLSFRRATRAKLNGKNLTCPDKLFSYWRRALLNHWRSAHKLVIVSLQLKVIFSPTGAFYEVRKLFLSRHQDLLGVVLVWNADEETG